MNHAGKTDERSLTDLFSDVTKESSDLVRKQIELAKLEFSEKISELKSGVIGMLIAAPLLYAGLLFLLVAAVLGIDTRLQTPWLSALLVGGGVTAIGAVALIAGRERVEQTDPTPQRTVESLREDTQMVKHHLSPTEDR